MFLLSRSISLWLVALVTLPLVMLNLKNAFVLVPFTSSEDLVEQHQLPQQVNNKNLAHTANIASAYANISRTTEGYHDQTGGNSSKALTYARTEDIQLSNSSEGRGTNSWFDARAAALTAERDAAAAQFREGKGFLWFLHTQKAGGSSVCKRLESKLLKHVIPEWKKIRDNTACLLKRKCFYAWLQPHFRSSCSPKVQSEHWSLKQTINASVVRFHTETLQALIKDSHPKRTLMASEASFIPRPVLNKWIIEGGPEYSDAFSKWSFIFNIRHPVDRLYSAFHYHDEFFRSKCGYDFMKCLSNNVLGGGMHRNKMVKELSGWFSISDIGEPNGNYAGGKPPVEATRQDLEVAKLVLHRFLPVVVADDPEFLMDTLADAVGMIGLRYNKSRSDYRQANVNKQAKTPMSAEERKLAMELNSLDMELYEYVVNRTGLYH